MSTPFAYVDPASPNHNHATSRERLLQQWRDQLDDVRRLTVDLTRAHRDQEAQAKEWTDHVDLVARLLVAASRHLEDVEAALDRVDDGSYGTCVRCQLPIPSARLAALPAARFCASCQPAFRGAVVALRRV